MTKNQLEKMIYQLVCESFDSEFEPSVDMPKPGDIYHHTSGGPGSTVVDFYKITAVSRGIKPLVKMTRLGNKYESDYYGTKYLVTPDLTKETKVVETDLVKPNNSIAIGGNERYIAWAWNGKPKEEDMPLGGKRT